MTFQVLTFHPIKYLLLIVKDLQSTFDSVLMPGLIRNKQTELQKFKFKSKHIGLSSL